jgi:uncharacterized protein
VRGVVDAEVVMRGVLLTAAIVGVAWLAMVLLATVFQRQLIYLPDTASPPQPDDVEAMTFATEDGLELTGWWLAAPDAVSTVLVLPGNAGHRGLRLPLARGLVARGHAVMLLDYRGFGGNPGSPSEDGLLADARAARRHLVDQPEVTPETLVYLGESIGTGVAAALAAEAPPAALVLRSPFPELADVGRSAYPFLPVGWLLRERFPVIRHLEAYDGPLLVVAGDADTIVPTELSRQVAQAHRADLVSIAGADHNDAALLSGDRYLDAVDRHVRRAVGVDERP